MPRFYLMRHAKSDWHAVPTDIDRPLNARGAQDAERIGKELARRAPAPGTIITSPATRARQTAMAVAAAFPSPPPIETIDMLYLADAATLRAALERHIDRHPLLIAHNPGLDGLLLELCGSHVPRTTAGKLMTTANVAIIDTEGGDALHLPGACRLIELIRPKAL